MKVIKKICLLVSVGADVVVVVADVVTMGSDEASAVSEVEVSIGDTGCCTDAAVLSGGTIAVAVSGAAVVTVPCVGVVTGSTVTVVSVSCVAVVTGATVTVVTVASVTVVAVHT